MSIQSQFNQALINRHITLNLSENSAVTMYFGAKSIEDLNTEKAKTLYKQGQILVQKIIKES